MATFGAITLDNRRSSSSTARSSRGSDLLHERHKQSLKQLAFFICAVRVCSVPFLCISSYVVQTELHRCVGVASPLYLAGENKLYVR